MKISILFQLLFLFSLISCEGNRSKEEENIDEKKNTAETYFEVDIVDDPEVMLAPIYNDNDRLGYYENESWKTVFWDDFSFNLPFSDYDIEEIEGSDNFEKKTSKIHNGVIYQVRLSDYGEGMMKDRDFDTGFLYYRHQGQTADAELFSEIKYNHISKNSPAIYSCFKYSINDKEYFEDLITIKEGQYIFEMSVIASPLHENFYLVQEFFDSFILL